MNLMTVAVKLYRTLDAMVSNIESGEVVVDAWADPSGRPGINHDAAKAAMEQARPLLTAALAGRNPQTEAECVQEWRELMAKQAREDAILLADQLGQ